VAIFAVANSSICRTTFCDIETQRRRLIMYSIAAERVRENFATTNTQRRAADLFMPVIPMTKTRLFLRNFIRSRKSVNEDIHDATGESSISITWYVTGTGCSRGLMKDFSRSDRAMIMSEMRFDERMLESRATVEGPKNTPSIISWQQ